MWPAGSGVGGAWPGVQGGVAPAIPMMGSYTPEQWAAWQQWAQWQQQYAQWQNQYGEKYAAAMQAQAKDKAGPPLPSAMPNQPAPPPPEKPPPPPHENDQPLFQRSNASNVQSAVASAHLRPSDDNRRSSRWSDNTSKPQSGFENSNRSTDKAAEQGGSAGNKEALTRLAEEERLFDIQFQKWEEEFEKWKEQNVNHPDKKAYAEYEQKFMTCRAQLLERRQQMKKRRQALTNCAPVQQALAPQAYSAPPSIVQNNTSPSQGTNILGQTVIQKQYQQMHSTTNNSNQFQPSQSYNAGPYLYQNAVLPPPPPPLSTGNLQANFLPSSDNRKGIPGLDLVDEEGSNKQKLNQGFNIQQQPSQEYSALSKGINNILGDEKILQVLSLVQGQKGQINLELLAPLLAQNSSNNSTPTDNGVQQNHFGQDQNYSNHQYKNHPNQEKQNYPNQQTQNYPSQQRQNYQNQQTQNYSDQQQQNYQNQQPKNFQNTQAQNYSNQNQQSYQDQHQNYQSQSGGGMDRNDNYNTQGGGGGHSHWSNNGNQSQGPFNQNAPANFAIKPLMSITGLDPKIGTMRDAPPKQDEWQGPCGPPHPGQGPTSHLGQRSTPHSGHGSHGQGQRPHSVFGPGPQGPSSLLGQGSQGPSSLLGAGPQGPSSLLGSGSQGPSKHPGGPQQPRNGMQTAPPVEEPPWVEEPIVEPTIIVDYSHNPLRSKVRDFIEPVQTFDYNHLSKEGEKRPPPPDRWSELDAYNVRSGTKVIDYNNGRSARDGPFDTRRDWRDDRRRDDERRPRDDERRPRDDERRPRDDERRREDDRWREDERRRRDDERTSVGRRRSDDRRRDVDKRRIDRSMDRPRDHSPRERDRSGTRTESPAAAPAGSNPVVMIDDILEHPGRDVRPEKIVILLRGIPGSGKSYLAKLIKEREIENGGSAPRILSIDDYFIQECEIEERDHSTGKMVKKPSMRYVYDERSEENYLASLKRAFRRTVTDQFFPFIIVDAVNDLPKYFAEFRNFGRQNGFVVYTCTLTCDAATAHRRNIHDRTYEDIQVIAARFAATPKNYVVLDSTALLQRADIREVDMEDAIDEVVMEEANDGEDHAEEIPLSKWETMEDYQQLARLDGTSRPLRPSTYSLDEYLQLDEVKAPRPGKKTVRWADIEERREQEKMRAIGFVVGQTDWHRMTDPSQGANKLEQTKYIERIGRKQL